MRNSRLVGVIGIKTIAAILVGKRVVIDGNSALGAGIGAGVALLTAIEHNCHKANNKQ